MHHFYYFALFPVTALAVAGYVTLYCARNSQGRMQTAGKILAAWTFLLAIGVALMAVIHPFAGHRHHGHFGQMGSEMGDDMGTVEQSAPPEQIAPVPAPNPAPAPATEMKAPASDAPVENPGGWKTN